ncbi:MAG: cytosine deaminase, partial [Alsobacter sp.]
MAFDCLVRGGVLPDGTRADIGIVGDRIVAIGPGLQGDAGEIVEAGGQLVSPPFVDVHFHMDATLSYGLPRINRSGTLLEGIALWGELKPHLTHEAVSERALAYIDWAVSMGLLAVRTHVDVCDDRLLAVEALLDVKKRVASYFDLQLVAFPQDGYYRSPGAIANLARALDMGVEVVGGIPHGERTMEDGRRSMTALCEIAATRGLMVDIHCDETDDPLSRHIEQLVYETQRLGLGGRVAGSHLTSMHSMDNYYVSKLIPLMAEAGVAAIPNPLINIMLQGRHDTYPRRRGMTRVPEMLAAGVTVAFGQDCVLDPWYSLGTADMLDVAFMGLHVAQMSSPADMRRCYDLVT